MCENLEKRGKQENSKKGKQHETPGERQAGEKEISSREFVRLIEAGDREESILVFR